jgi:hypothetical protein
LLIAIAKPIDALTEAPGHCVQSLNSCSVFMAGNSANEHSIFRGEKRNARTTFELQQFRERSKEFKTGSIQKTLG